MRTNPSVRAPGRWLLPALPALPLLCLLSACETRSASSDRASGERAARGPRSGEAAGGAGVERPSARPAWALALHGGAGTIPRTMPEERQRLYLDALHGALGEGRDRLERGEPALDVVEALVRRLEDDPLFNAGRGAVFTFEGRHELDAAIMDGSTLATGAVAGVTTVRHPITLARAVMARTKHVLLSGEGAERFADVAGVERVANEWFSTEARRKAWQDELAKIAAEERDGGGHGTVGVVALDRAGHLAAGTSTGGTTAKRWGRIGDTPIVGAGTFADDATAAISCTGKGEQFIRHGVAREVAALMRYRGLTLEAAARELVHGRLDKDDGGLVAVGRDGAIALVFNSDGMYRGAADASGRFEVAIWE
jgi:beta-aspartyl-peptidase (threonine type)